MIINMVHFPQQSIKEEVANMLMLVYGDKEESLLEIEKLNPNYNAEEEVRLNFDE